MPADWINNQNGFICVHRDDGELCIYIPPVIGKREVFCLPDGRTLTIIVDGEGGPDDLKIKMQEIKILVENKK